MTMNKTALTRKLRGAGFRAEVLHVRTIAGPFTGVERRVAAIVHDGPETERAKIREILRDAGLVPSFRERLDGGGTVYSSDHQ